MVAGFKRFCQVLKGAVGVTRCQNEAEVIFQSHCQITVFENQVYTLSISI